MRTVPRALTLLVIGVASIGCIANNTNTTRSTSHKPSEAKSPTDIVGVDSEGKKFHLSDYRGKVVLLDFWATY